MSVKVRQDRSYIDGEWVGSSDGEEMEILNPATEEVIATVPRSTVADVDRAVAAASTAFESWVETTPQERMEMLIALANRLEENHEEFEDLDSLNVGKIITQARTEMIWAADNLRFFAAASRFMEGKSAGEYLRGHTSYIRREPIGVVGQIAPWNYPLCMAVWKIGPALSAGNTVVLKPADATPLTALRLAELSEGILPAGVLNVVTGTGPQAGQRIVEHPDVRMVSLTGSTETGKHVARLAANTVKRLHLELGGKTPVLVFDDADLDAAAGRIIEKGFCNSGQDCMAASRILATPGVYDELLERLTAKAASMKVDNPAVGESVEMGPLVTKAHQERVLGFIDRAVSAGASVHAGGSSTGARGFFVEPTIMAGAEQRSELVQREIFGPVISVQRVEDEEAAVKWANDCDYGLTASVYTANVGRALRMTRRLNFGTVWVNTHDTTIVEFPHGGFKQSGYGKDMSMYAVEEYTNIKNVMISHA